MLGEDFHYTVLGKDFLVTYVFDSPFISCDIKIMK